MQFQEREREKSRQDRDAVWNEMKSARQFVVQDS